jgi:hypothetical protein
MEGIEFNRSNFEEVLYYISLNMVVVWALNWGVRVGVWGVGMKCGKIPG